MPGLSSLRRPSQPPTHWGQKIYNTKSAQYYIFNRLYPSFLGKTDSLLLSPSSSHYFPFPFCVGLGRRHNYLSYCLFNCFFRFLEANSPIAKDNIYLASFFKKDNLYICYHIFLCTTFNIGKNSYLSSIFISEDNEDLPNTLVG